MGRFGTKWDFPTGIGERPLGILLGCFNVHADISMDNIFSWIKLSSLLWQQGMVWEAPGGFCCLSPERLDAAVELIRLENLYPGILIFPTKIYSQISLLKASPLLLPSFWAAQPSDF